MLVWSLMCRKNALSESLMGNDRSSTVAEHAFSRTARRSGPLATVSRFLSVADESL